MNPMNRRTAVTLTEVLMAIFIMGIGLMAILSLFPLGAAQMAQALKDQRCAEAANNAGAMFRVIWKQACDAEFQQYGKSPPTFLVIGGGRRVPFSVQQFVMNLDTPYSGIGTDLYPIATPAMPQLDQQPNYSGPSYPVFLDPIGWTSNRSNPIRQAWLAGGAVPPVAGSPTVPPVADAKGNSWPIRRTYLTVPPPGNSPAGTGGTELTGIQRILKQTSLLDDVTFDETGRPKTSSGIIERQGRYTWAYLVQRPNNSIREVVNVSVVVYSGRSIDVPSPESAYAAARVPMPGLSPPYDPKRLQLAYTGAKPVIRRGGWILDATMTDSSGNLSPQGVFYRVVDVDDSTPNVLDLELQSNLAGDALGGPANRVIIILENVVEVFPKYDISHNSAPMPY